MLKTSPRIYLDLEIGFTNESCLVFKLTIASRQKVGTVSLDFEVLARPAEPSADLMNFYEPPIPAAVICKVGKMRVFRP